MVLIIANNLAFNATLTINSGVRKSSCLPELCCGHCSGIFLLSQLFWKNPQNLSLAFTQFYLTIFACNGYGSIFSQKCCNIRVLELRVFRIVWVDDKKMQKPTDRVKKTPFIPQTCVILLCKGLWFFLPTFEFIIFPSSCFHQCPRVLFPSSPSILPF